MTHSIADAMREATRTVRSGDPARASEIIQRALAGTKAPRAAGSRSATLHEPSLGQARPHRGLRETLDLLKTGRPGTPSPMHGGFAGLPRMPDNPAQDDTRFPSLTFACDAGSRDYRLHIPDLAGSAPSGLVVMLHGCTQTPADFAAGTGMNALADRHGLIVAYPAQPRGANMQSCWNWFSPNDQARGRGEPAILAGMAARIAAEHGISRARTFVAGLSAGAAMAVILGQAYADVFAAVGAHSGLAHASAHDVPSAFAAMRGHGDPRRDADRGAGAGDVRTIIFQGGSDSTVAPANAARIADDARASIRGQGTEILDDGIQGGRRFRRAITLDAKGSARLENWEIEGLGHAWSGGQPAGSYTDAAGPDASAEMIRFFLQSRDG